MKRVQKNQQKEDQTISSIMRRLFELQIELIEFNEQHHDYDDEFLIIIETLDSVFEKVMKD